MEGFELKIKEIFWVKFHTGSSLLIVILLLKFLSGVKILRIFQLIYPKKKRNRKQNETGNGGGREAAAHADERSGAERAKRSSPAAEA